MPRFGSSDCRGFNEVRAAKPGVSVLVSRNSNTSGVLLQRGPGCEARSVVPEHGELDGCAAASTRSGLRSPECLCTAPPLPPRFARASMRSGLRSPECRLQGFPTGDGKLRLQRGPGCEARSVKAG